MTDQPFPSSRERFFSLDILRGLAAFLVLWRHLPVKPQPSQWAGDGVLEVLHQIGWCGVDLFFVLSGFLISNLLFREFRERGRLNLPLFWLRRGFKIWPSYFAAYGLMAALNLAAAAWSGDRESWRHHARTLLPNTLFIQNYLPYEYRWDNSWSIAVEEHFYLTIPLVLMGLALWGARRAGASPAQWFRPLPWLAAAAAVVVLTARLVQAGHGAGDGALYYPTHYRFDSLLCGVVLGYAWNFRSHWIGFASRHGKLLLLITVMTTSLPYFLPLGTSWVTHSLGFTVLYLGFGGLVALAAANADFGRTGWGKPLWGILAWMGTYSYTIYLAHSVVLDIPGMSRVRAEIVSWAGGPAALAGAWADRLLFLSLSIAGGVVLAKLVEQPCLRLRQRWFPSRGGRMEPPADQRIESLPARLAA